MTTSMIKLTHISGKQFLVHSRIKVSCATPIRVNGKVSHTHLYFEDGTIAVCKETPEEVKELYKVGYIK
jgi:hypothetical protein